MLTVVTGRPHPDLETALRSSLGEWRSRADFSEAVVVVPSGEMRRHLLLRIARGWGEAFVGLRLVTAQGLARMILEDPAAGESGGREAAPPALLEELLRGLLRSGGFPRLGGLAGTAGGPAALLSTLSDLTESCLSAGAIEDSERDEVLRLYAAFDRVRREAGLPVHADLVRDAAVVSLSDSGRVSEVFYHGFYDMTGSQAELLASVARAARVTFFLPLGEGPSYDFARAFFDEVLKPLADGIEAAPCVEGPRPLVEPALARLFEPMTDAEAGPPEPGARPRVISVSGTEAELEAAAREVLRLVEGDEGSRGLAWGEVAVIARTLAPYVPHIESVFNERRIPFRSSACLPAGAFPAAKAAAAMVRVFADGMRRKDVIDLVSSPFFARSRFGVSGDRAAYWDLLSKQLRIIGGETQWAKLKPIAEGGAARIRREDEEEFKVDVEAARELWKCVDPLIDAHATFPEEGSWDELASAFERAFDEFLRFSVADHDADPDVDERQAGLFEGLRRAVREVRGFGAVSEKTTRAGFLGASSARLGEATVPLGDDRCEAVEILDAMAARCRSFRAVVLIGMGGGLFPRAVAEDAFLSDRKRAALAEKHSVRLTEKRAGFDEEKLLFHLVLAGVGEHLTLIRQRSDDEGKPLVRSWYLDELYRASGGPAAFEEVSVPRLFADRLRGEARGEGGDLAYLTPREWREGLVIAGARERKLWDAVSAGGAMLGRALAASDELARAGPAPSSAKATEGSALHSSEGAKEGALGPRDGITGPLPRFFDEMNARGFSPTALQKYAACPFAFFAAKVLGLEAVEEAEVAFEPQPIDKGTVLHSLLETFFTRLVEAGHFSGRKSKVDWDALLTESAEAAFAEAESRIATGSPLIWEREKAKLLALAREYAEGEIAKLDKEGWVPFAFEVKDSACMSDSEAFPENVRSLRLYGFIDRLDRREVEGHGKVHVEARVVDYKFRSGASRRPEDNNLARGAVRGRAIQPPVYLLMAKDIVKGAAGSRAEFHFIAPKWSDGPVVTRELPPGCWSSKLGLQVARTISRVIDGIAKGEWFAAPGPHCDYCEFSRVCRKSHGPTRYRFVADGRARSLEALAKQDPPGGGKKKAAKKAAKKSPKKAKKKAKNSVKKRKKKGGS